MATKKKNAPKAKVSAKKVVSKGGTKFKRKNSDGTSGRKGTKTFAIWVDAGPLVDLISKGPTPQNVMKILDKVASRFDQKTMKSFLRQMLDKVDEKTRAGLLNKYCGSTLSAQDKKALTLGRRVLKMSGTTVK